MSDISGFNFWVNNPDFRLFCDEAKPGWCEVSAPLMEWADELIDLQLVRQAVVEVSA